VSKVKAIINGMNKEIAEGVLSTDEVAAPADNYLKELKGQIMKWPASRMPIKVFIASGSSVPGYKLSFDSVLRQSFAEWSEASNGLVTFQFVPNEAAANLVCSWTNDPGTMKNRRRGRRDKYIRRPPGYRARLDKVLTVPLVQALPVTDNFLKQTCLHEIGHALGFGGHTNNKSDTMFFTIRLSDQPPSLSARDKRSIQLLYEGNNTQ
jgi:Matrixin.